MRFQTWMLAAAFALVATAASADDPMSNTYGNTVTTKNAKTGAVGQLLFNADGTYTAKGMGPDGKSSEYPGKWTLKDNGATLCLAPQLPPDTPNPPAATCSPLAVHPVGEHWNVTNDAGETFDVAISAGR